jgi:hexosaminidase
MKVKSDQVYIGGDNSAGVFYGIQSFIQLLPSKIGSSISLPNCEISDYPRFAYRGLHLDVSRHFFPVAYIKRYIDYIAYHKMNVFHWHLTDDQGWRIEIKKYPLLTEVGGWRDGTLIGKHPGKGYDTIRHGGFYTQEQIKEVVAYATSRHVEVIPEIEMPGHSMAAIAAYPFLSTTPNKPKRVAKGWVNYGEYEYNNVLNPSDSTFKFLEDVLSEVMELFPSKYVHVGGDECSKRWWKESAFCQQLKKDKGLKDEKAIQSYFIQRMEKFVNSKGKKIIGWNEILQGGLAPNATVMSWMGTSGGITAAKKNHDVIMTPGNACYFDHPQRFKDDSTGLGKPVLIDSVYAYNPMPKVLSAEQQKYILGAQANVWTEYIGNTSKLEYMLFPRLAAISEVVWTPQKDRSFAGFKKRMNKQFERYEFWGINYCDELKKR